MSDLPDDLPAIGTHRGNDAPEGLGQTINAPEGPDPSASPAHPTDALFQLVEDTSGDFLQIRTHSARAQVDPPEEAALDERGQYRTVDALRDALADASVEGWTGVFENPTAGRVLTDEVTPQHAWIGAEVYPTITLFPDADAATEYASSLSLSSE
ncbi:MAG: hypothetical protein ACLFTE_08100 [Salinivenus sp.]